METEKWLGVDEIAKHLGVASITVYRWLDKGRIPSHRVGKLWRFKASSVDAWVAEGGAEDIRTKKAPAKTTQTESNT